MAATVASRSARSTAPGVSKGRPASPMRALARVMRCSIAASPTRKARAICLTDRPQTMRSASAICCVAGSSGWQQTNSSRRMSSRYCSPSSRSASSLSASSRSEIAASSGSATCLRAPAHVVHRRVAADEDQPRRGVARRAVLRPGLQRAQAGLLESFLGRIEIAEVAQQRPHCLGARGGQDRVDPADVVHAAGFRSTASWLSCSSATGRIS